MTSTPLSRRNTLLAGAAAAAALLPLREAVAQTAAAGGDWFAMVKAHHALIARTFDEVLASDGKPAAARDRLLKKLAYQLTAHSVAEENVLYPALALNGMTTESDKLYLDQAHAKVMNADLDMTAMMKGKPQGGGAWLDKAKALQAAVLKHAKEDEEADLYPKLQQKLDAGMNAMLTAEYRRQFGSVKPA